IPRLPEIVDCALICLRAHVQRPLQWQGFLPSRPARDHRAARHQARWLTEVGRLHLVCGENRKELPSIYSEASKKENINKRITKSLGVRAEPPTFRLRRHHQSAGRYRNRSSY